jgi:EAL domain-containing protein (putative c-di-GMP-specific phosphodiesterase class I)
LHQKGIKFYLDDFGTGYSNFQRVFSLPLDLIKFDRSVTILATENQELFNSIKTLAKVFTDAGMKVLYEGVETDIDVARCVNMYASYLQGYAYAKPIKIEKLSHYFMKRGDRLPDEEPKEV